MSDERSEMLVQSHTLALFGMSIQRAEMDFDFEIIKHQIQLATDEIGHATSEKQMYFLYTSKTELIMTAMGPLLDKADNDRFKSEYNALKDSMKKCYAGYVKVHWGGDDGAEYSISIRGPKYDNKSTLDSDDDDPSALQCHPKEYERTMLMAEENLYRRMNCSAREQFRDALGLAFRVGMLNASDRVQIQRDRPMKNMSGVPNVR